jgi:hypothetical protein
MMDFSYFWSLCSCQVYGSYSVKFLSIINVLSMVSLVYLLPLFIHDQMDSSCVEVLRLNGCISGFG